MFLLVHTTAPNKQFAATVFAFAADFHSAFEKWIQF